MKLTKISATNFKGSSFSYDLTAVTVFVGLNFKGKTRVMDAIRLGLIGYLPELGRTNKATFGLASAKDMSVSLTFDTGDVLFRRFMLKGDTVKTEEGVPEVLKEAGTLSVMLDASLYFGLTDQQRVNYVFSHCRLPETFNRLGIMARLGVSGDEHGTRTKLADRLNQDLVSSEQPQEYVENMIVAATLSWKSSKEHAQRMEKTIQGLSALRAGDDPTSSIIALEDTRARLTREVADVMEKRGRLLGGFTQMKADRARREEIDRELRFADKNRTQLVELQNKLALVRADLEKSPVVDAATVQRLGQEVSSCKNLVTNLTTAAANHLKDKERAEKLLAALDAQTVCPYCGATGEGWKTLNAAELAKGIDEAGQQQALALRQRGEAVADQTAAEVAYSAAVGRQSTRQARVDLKALVLRDIAKIEPALQRLGALEEEKNRLMADDPALTAQIDTLQSELNVKNEELRRTDIEIKAVQGRAHELKRLADAEKERDTAKAEQDEAAVVGKELKVIQGEMVAAAFAPLLARANGFFGAALKFRLAYNAAQGGEIGYWSDGLWVGHSTMSGTEKLLVYAAIQMALSADSPVKVMLLDELGRLDGNSVSHVLLALLDAVKDGRLDNVIGIDVGRADHYRALSDSNCSVIEIQ